MMDRRTVVLGSRRVADGEPCFITFEAGPTHSGLESAKRLCRLAAEAGADAVKFQILDPDRLVADRSIEMSFEVLADRKTGETRTVKESLHELLRRRWLPEQDWRALKAYCDQLGLAFFATAGFADEIDFIASLDCHSIKIASADVDHLPLIRHAARTGLCLQLDTGNATLGEIEVAIDAIRAEGNENVIIHQCPSGYPARLDSINLNVIPTLKRMFPYPVAFSDHTPGWHMDIAALAMGANLLEKTITEDRTTPSIEHIMSLEPAEMREFVQTVREVERAFGTTRRIMHDAELERRMTIRRSIHVRLALPAGHVLTENDLDYRRPGFGISPAMAGRCLGHRLAVAKEAGARLEWADIGAAEERVAK